jgi:hypothetical protein
MANDIFSSGIILSEFVNICHAFRRNLTSFCYYSTDFRQFEQYLNVTGLDVGLVFPEVTQNIIECAM